MKIHTKKLLVNHFNLPSHFISDTHKLSTLSLMASCFAPVSVSGGSVLTCDLSSTKSNSFGKTRMFVVQRKSSLARSNRKLSVCAEYNDSGRGGGGGDFVAGFLVGGAVFGALAYIFAPQCYGNGRPFGLPLDLLLKGFYSIWPKNCIRRSVLNEDEYGFRRAKRPMYYDEGLEKTRQTLNAKISQLNSAIDNVSSRLRGGNSSPPTVPLETDPEVEATL